MSTPDDMDTTARDNISPLMKLLISISLKSVVCFFVGVSLHKIEKQHIPIHPIDAFFQHLTTSLLPTVS